MVRYLVLALLSTQALGKDIFLAYCPARPTFNYVALDVKTNLPPSSYMELCSGNIKLTKTGFLLSGSTVVKGAMQEAYEEIASENARCVEHYQSMCRYYGGRIAYERPVAPYNVALISASAKFVTREGADVAKPNSDSRFVACGLVLNESFFRPLRVQCIR